MTENKSKKQVILEAAARLFRDRGYSATSMRDLAQAVDLKASSLYNHISSKEEILQEICFTNANAFLSGMKRIEQSAETAKEKVEALIHLHIRMATEDITSITAFNDEWRHLSHPQLEQFVTLRRDYETRFKTIIRQGIEAGEFKALDPTISLFTILSSIRWVYDWFKPGREIKVKQLEKEIVAMLMDGLGR